MFRDPRRKIYDPTPEEIRNETAAIRAAWSEHERARRSHYRTESWMPPVFPLSHFPVEEESA